MVYHQRMKKSTLLKKLKISQYRLAQLLGLSRQAVSQWGADVPPERENEMRRIWPEAFQPKVKK